MPVKPYGSTLFARERGVGGGGVLGLEPGGGVQREKNKREKIEKSAD